LKHTLIMGRQAVYGSIRVRLAAHASPSSLLSRPLNNNNNNNNINRACYGVLRYVMESGAKGCEVIVSGKLRAARAKAMKFKDGYMVSSGEPTRTYIDSAVRHVLLRQGVLGIKVRRAS